MMDFETTPARSEALQSLLFDPLSYLHSARLQLPPRLLQGSAARAIVNELLVSAFGLQSHCVDADLGQVGLCWLRHWRRLPQVAYLLGCHGMRAELARGGKWLQLPTWAKRFVTIDRPSNRVERYSAPIGHLALCHIGYCQLIAWGEPVPPAFIERLPLQFPPGLDSMQPKVVSADPLLVTLAIQHAQRHPHTPPYENS